MGLFKKSNEEIYVESRVKSNSLGRKLRNKDLTPKQREKIQTKKDKADAQRAASWAGLNDRSARINQTIIKDSFKSDKSKKTAVSLKVNTRSKRFK